MGIKDKLEEKANQEKNKIKNKFKRKILIPVVAGIVVLMLLLLSFYAIIMTVQGTLINLMSNVTTSVSDFWKWMKDDYWIKLDKEIEFSYLNEETEVEKKSKATLVDEYIRNLENLGISLKDLGLLGDIDYKNGDARLTEKELIEKILTDNGYKDQKETVEKYVKEFIKADLITQSIHRRRGTELINKHNDDWIDGGVYLYRTKQTTDTSGALQISADEYIKEIGKEEYVQMQYVTPDEWQELVNNKDKKIRYRYTLDEEGNVVIAKVKTVETIEGNISNFIDRWFEDVQDWMNQKFGIGADSTEIIIEGEEHIDYKAYISKYTMPYEFLVSLCEITGSPEFVYHVAMLARQTEIDLVVQDDSTVDRVVTETEEKYESYENQSSSATSGASKTGEEKKKKRKIVVTTTTNPHLEIEYANTWSFYEEYEYTKNIEQTVEENGPITQKFGLPSTLGNYQEEVKIKETNYAGVEIERTIPEKWYDTFLTETKTSTQTTTTVTTYNPGILVNSVEKSKQFLGLLRNEEGKCYYEDCYKNPHRAEVCAEKAEFLRSGTNVGYQKPNSSKNNDKPLNELLNKADMLYAILGENIEGNEYLSAEEDGASQYKVKMQGLIDHMKYLMTFPENEDLDIAYEQDEEDEVDLEEIEVEYEELDEEDLELLYKLCEAEAGGSSEQEIGHVACVVLNRVKCSRWPSTIKEVIYQPGQFSCVPNGLKEPSEKTKRAVDSIITGGDTTGGAVYFRTHASAKKAGIPTSASEKHSTYIYLFEDPNTHIFYTDQKSLEELRASTGGTSPATGKLTDIFPDGIPTTREGIQKYLVTIQVPITTKQGKKTTAPLTIHKDVAEDVKNALQKAQDEGFIVYEVGGFSWRKISGSTKMSQHSLGLAVDINVKENYCVYPNGKVDAGSFWDPNRSEYSIPRGGALYNAFKGIGWGWGGDWSSKKDYMHFSYTGG